MERRRESRLFIEAPGVYRRAGGMPRGMFFSQISVSGCRIMERDCPLEIGETIALSLGSVEDVSAIVRWRSEGLAGVEFAQALDPAIVQFFAAYCGPPA